MRMGWGVGGNDAEAILRSLPTLALRYRAQDDAARALAGWLQRASRSGAVAPSGLRGLARTRALAGAVRRQQRRRRRRAVLGGVPRALQRRPGRCLLRRAETVQARLFLGRPGQPGRALRHRLHAQPGWGLAAQRRAGALFGGAGSGGRPARRPRAGAGRTGEPAATRRRALSLTLAPSTEETERLWLHPITDTRSGRKSWPRSARKRTSSRPRPTASRAARARATLPPTKPEPATSRRPIQPSCRSPA